MYAYVVEHILSTSNFALLCAVAIIVVSECIAGSKEEVSPDMAAFSPIDLVLVADRTGTDSWGRCGHVSLEYRYVYGQRMRELVYAPTSGSSRRDFIS